MVAVLETRGLRKEYGPVVALDSLDLTVQRGEVFGFLGPNGAGKTTFTKCVTGFVRPTAGSVSVCGIDALAHPTKVASHIGLVPDQYDFYPNLTGRQHLEFYGRLLGMPTHQRRDRIAEVLDLVAMADRADRRVKGYSHGMKQRICIAQAILHKPDLLLFDEPTNGLDPKGAYELREMIRGLAKDGTTVFLNSHQLSEVEQVCARVAIVDRGRLVAVDSVHALQRRASGNMVEVRVLNPSAKLVTAAAKFVRAKPVLDGSLLRFAASEEETANVLTALVAAGARVVSVQQAGSLESAFLQLTATPEVPA
ncbi:MAG: type transport system ATP-binding protein [Thermoplasmata archaeon]|jgi:ABC-2 type transport system ATP-binding protein|nr:type transport system ATP-binding protein [Thermoplasmata archaeon]